MDSRTALKKNERLLFPGMECVIDAPAGRGANVLAYIGHYKDLQHKHLTHTVLIRELFPYDPMGRIFRGEDGDLHVHPSAREYFDWHRMTFLRGNEVHLRLSGQIPSKIDLNINTFSCRGTLYSLLGFTGGRSLEDEIGPEGLLNPAENTANTGDPDGLLRIVRVMRGALEVLKAFHQEGYLHLDISPDNILLIGEPDTERVTLIDYNSVHTVEEVQGRYENDALYSSVNAPEEVPAGCREHEFPLRRAAGCPEDRTILPPVDLSTKEGYTSPEVRLCRFESIGPHSDLYSMAAVFWHCLSGQRLEGLSWVGAVLPDPGELPRWKNLSGPVLSMLRQILRKGLVSSPRRRYRSADEMLADFGELEDRITCRGITRWSLWENGRARLISLMRENTGLQYIRDDSALYPIKVEQEDGSRVDFRRIAARSQESPVLLLGGGGMGKTTALCRIAHEAYAGEKDFNEDATAVFYISLYGYRDGGDHFLRDTILEGLKFKPQTDSMETARRELMQLLDRPSGHAVPAQTKSAQAEKTQAEKAERKLAPAEDNRAENAEGKLAPAENTQAENAEGKRAQTESRQTKEAEAEYTQTQIADSISTQKDGAESFQKKRKTKPVLLLLLDGLNEASGQTGPLLHEIHLLASKPGVQVLLTSRSDPGDPLFQKYILCRLDLADVKIILSNEGILPPENMELMDLLCFPILLSVYIETVKSGGTGTGRMSSREELLDEYFLALRKKESRNLSDSRITREGVDAVLRYLLPEIAASIHQSGHSLTDRELLAVVEKCYRELSGRALTQVYPEWIGHSSDLRLGTGTADEWYGMAVLDILWRRTGLLVRDEKGCFRIQHQIFEEYLAAKSREFHQTFDQIKKSQRNWRLTAAGSLVLVFVTLFAIYNYRMRLQITRKHEQMILAEAERNSLEYISQSQQALEKGDRREAVRSAADALLLQYADLKLAETALLEEDGLSLLRNNLPALRERLLSENSREENFASEYGPALPAGEYAAAAQKALTDALGVYDLTDTFRSDYVMELPSAPDELFLSPGGSRLCAVCSGELLLYDTESGEEILSFSLCASRPGQAVFSDEDTIIYTDQDALCAYDLVRDLAVWQAAPAGLLAISSDLRRAAAVTPDKTGAFIYSTADGKVIAEISFGGRQVSFGDPRPQRQQKASQKKSLSAPGSSLFSLNRDGSLLAASFEDGSISCFDVAAGKAFDLPGSSPGTCFEGGFCGNILAWSALRGGKSVCLAVDTAAFKAPDDTMGAMGALTADSAAETAAPRASESASDINSTEADGSAVIVDCFSSDYDCLLQAGEDGIFVAEQNILYSWNPERKTDAGSMPIVFSGRTVDPDTVPERKDDHDLGLIAAAAETASDPLISFCRTQNCLAAGTAAGQYTFFTKAESVNGSAENGAADGTGLWLKDNSFEADVKCDFVALAGDRALCGSRDSLYVNILKKNTPPKSGFFSYDPDYPHTEARLSADRRTIILYSDSGLRVWSAENGRSAGHAAFPQENEVHDLKFRREEGKSLLQVTWDDGTVCCYSAADGSLLSRSKTDLQGEENPNMEFLTDQYRIVCPPQEPFTIYDRMTGEDLGGYYEDGTLVSIDQTGSCILATYILPRSDDRLGILFNESFDSLAYIPDICDTLDGELIVDCKDGRICTSRIYSLDELLELAQPYLRESY